MLTHSLRDVARLQSQEVGTTRLRMVTIQKDRHRIHGHTTGMFTYEGMGSDLMIASICRISVLFTIYSLAWFVLAHVFAYTSTNTCRLASPHIWWLTFSILCLTYIAIAEVLLMIIFIFIVGPILLVSASLLGSTGCQRGKTPHAQHISHPFPSRCSAVFCFLVTSIFLMTISPMHSV